MTKVLLDYIHLNRKHSGGKDQVGLNLLKGFYELGYTKDMSIVCYDYLCETVRAIAPDINIIALQSKSSESELSRMLQIMIDETTQIRRISKQGKYDVVFHINCNNGLRRMPIKSIVIPHDIKAVAHRVLGKVKIPFYKYILYRVMYRMDFAHADTIIAISDADKAEISKFYSRYATKVHRIYNPIDVQGDGCWIGQDSNYICALNIQFHHKNIITLIKAFELIKDQVDYNLLLIGSIPQRVAYLKEYVDQHGLSDRIIFTGYVSDEEMKTYLLKSRLYVNPTLFEGFGMTAVEAMIEGVPTLVSGIDANIEVTKGLCNYYSPADDAHVLADSIIECLNAKIDEHELKKNSEEMLKEYRYLKICEKYKELFERS